MQFKARLLHKAGLFLFGLFKQFGYPILDKLFQSFDSPGGEVGIITFAELESDKLPELLLLDGSHDFAGKREKFVIFSVWIRSFFDIILVIIKKIFLHSIAEQ